MKYETVREIHAKIANLTTRMTYSYCFISLGYAKPPQQMAAVLSLNMAYVETTQNCGSKKCFGFNYVIYFQETK